MAESAPQDEIELTRMLEEGYLPGDSAGKLAINPDTFVDDIEQAFRRFRALAGGTATDGEIQRLRQEAYDDKGWLSAYNGRVRSSWQLRKKIIGDLLQHKELSQIEKEALADNPSKQVRADLLNNYIVDAEAFEKALNHGEFTAEEIDWLLNSQWHALNNAQLETSEPHLSNYNKMKEIAAKKKLELSRE